MSCLGSTRCAGVPDDVLLWLRPPLCGLTLSASNGCGQVSLRRNEPTEMLRATARMKECRLVVVPKVGHLHRHTYRNEKARPHRGRALPFHGCLTMSYFRTEYTVLSSALRRFTTLFGMGRGGATSLLSSDVACRASSCQLSAFSESS